MPKLNKNITPLHINGLKTRSQRYKNNFITFRLNTRVVSDILSLCVLKYFALSIVMFTWKKRT